MRYQNEEVTAHGFRATAGTIFNSRGYEPDVIETALAHQDKNVIRRAYNRATYWDQRVNLMQDLSTPYYIPEDAIPLPPPDADVISTACDYCIVACG